MTSINPLTLRLLASLIRTLLAAIGGAGVALSDDELYQLISAGAVLVSLVWSAYQKIQERRKLLTAQAIPGPVSEETVKRVVSEGNAPPVTLSAKAVPYLPEPQPKTGA